MSEPVAEAPLVRWRGSASAEGRDAVAREEPLEIRINGAPVTVLMRTPGHDEDLAYGHLLNERIIAGGDEIASVRHCSIVDSPEAEDNVLMVTLRPGLGPDLERLRRNMFSSASCGMCGKASIAAALTTAPPLSDPARFAPGVLYALPDRLRKSQPVFAATGGLHAAGLFTAAGELLAVREDVGRHNAVDKVVGWAVRAGRPLAGHVLMVSGRTSFEIVQKAAAARIPAIAAVSAPTSLAVGLAQAIGITLVGFLRNEGMNVYSGGDRIG